MADLEYLWDRSIQIYPILNKSLKESTCSREDIDSITNQMVRLGIVDEIYGIALSNVDYILRHQIVPKFWSYFNMQNEPERSFYHFQLAICELHKEYERLHKTFRRMQPIVERLSRPIDIPTELNMLLKTTLLSQLPYNFNEVVYAFYQTSFKVFANSHQELDDETMEEIKCNGCEEETENCRCQELVIAFNKTNQYLYDMKLLDRLAGNTLTSLIQDRINFHVQDTCKGIFEISHLEGLTYWLDTIVLNWLTRIYNQGSSRINESQPRAYDVLKDFRVKLEYYLYQTYADNIIEQFFDIIIDFPDSLPAVLDLRKCLAKLDLKVKLVQSLQKSLEKRLLHPGVKTADILTGYVAAIKTIRALDSSGILLEAITDPVKQYMHSRSDTVRCVASNLTDDGATDLAEELAASENYVEDTNNNDLTNWDTWNPDPIDACTFTPRPSSKSADIISMVIDIYGTKDVFAHEYCSLLAERLLTQLDFNPEREIRNLELLKLRFGETLLRKCEVMLKDISDSKRINAHIHNDQSSLVAAIDDKSFNVSTLILSSEFWPTFKNDSLELSGELQAVFKRFTDSYQLYKGNRTLEFRPFIGRVDIEIEIGGRTLEMTVSPVHAVIIHTFQDQTEWHLEDLSHKIKVPSTTLRKRMTFWISHSIIVQPTVDFYRLVENANEAGTGRQTALNECDDDENESAMTSVSDQREEELQVFWSYIVGMLTNLDSLPLERIHQMLKMFASHGPGVEFSQEELKHFLQRKVREHALVFAGGVYHLPK